MYKGYSAACLLAFVFFFSYAVFAGDSPAVELKKQQKDFAVFKNGLLTVESRLDRHIPMDSINGVLSEMEKQFATKVLTPTEEYKLYARCVNLIQSGHTQVAPTMDVLRDYVLAGKALPFDMVIVNKHLYLAAYPEEKKKTKAASKKEKRDELPVGAEIIGIDGRTISQWMEKIGAFIGSDEDEPVFEYVVAGQAFDFYRFLATEEQKESLYVDYVWRRDTIRKSVKLGYPPVRLLAERFKALEKQADKDMKDVGKFKFVGNVGYFRFPSFVSGHGRKYSEFLEKSFKQLRKKGAETIVIDLRGNGGGIVQTQFLSYLMERPELVGTYRIDRQLKRKERKHIKKGTEEFRRYKMNMRRYRRAQRKIPGYAGQMITQPADTSLIYHGKIIVLTDEGTFSAASLLAAQLKTLRHAKIMGARAGGSYYANNAGTLHLVLPNSGISVILNPNTCASTLPANAIDPNVKNVDVEIVPDYDPKEANYKKNWEEVIKIAIKKGKRL